MEIVKDLNLNGNPQTVTNGSLIFAKNIKLSADGSYITNDEGFKVGVTPPYRFRTTDLDLFKVNCEYKGNGSFTNIVGYINCPNEIVIFTYNENDNSHKSRIYRLCEYSDTLPNLMRSHYNHSNEQFEFIPLNYHDNNIEHSIYNGSTGEVFIEDNTTYLCPCEIFSAWEYHGGIITGTYTYNAKGELIVSIAESDANTDVPLYIINLNTCSYNDSIESYTISPAVPIANLKLNERINSNKIPNGIYYFFVCYQLSNTEYTDWFPIGRPYHALSIEEKTIVNHKYNDLKNNTYASLFVNTNNSATYTFNFTINLTRYSTYKKLKLGYILQTDNSIIARENKIYNINIDSIDSTKAYVNFIFDTTNSKEIGIDKITKNNFNLFNCKAITNFNSKLYVANYKESYDDDYEALKEIANNIRVLRTSVSAPIITSEAYDPNSTFDLIDANGEIIVNGVSADAITNNQIDVTNPVFYDGNSNALIDYIVSTTSWQNITTSHLEALCNNCEVNLQLNGDGSTKLISAKDNETVLDDNIYYTFHQRGNEAVFHITYAQGGYRDFLWNNKITVRFNYSIDWLKKYKQKNVYKTLIPCEFYKFYIHFVRPDFTYTEGIGLTYHKVNGVDLDVTNINKFRSENIAEDIVYEYNFHPYRTDNGEIAYRSIAYPNDNGQLNLIGVNFENVQCPSKYIGYFFSYKKVQPTSYQVIVTDNLADNVFEVRGLEKELALVNITDSVFIPWFIYNETINDISYSERNIVDIKPILSNINITFNRLNVIRAGKEGGILLQLEDLGYDTSLPVGTIATILSNTFIDTDNDNLTSFGYIQTSTNTTYLETTENAINRLNYPGFLVVEPYIKYATDDNSGIYYSEDNNTLYKIDNQTGAYTDTEVKTDNYLDVKYYPKYSNYNLTAISIKKEPEDISVINKLPNDKTQIITGVTIKPINASDLFEVKSSYFENNYKTYIRYDITNTKLNLFTSVIRSSNVIKDESTENSWRIFNAEDYHIINKQYGDIIRLEAISKSILIHTKNNLLIATSDAKLTANNTNISLEQHQIFDVAPQELFTSDLGYGGIKYSICANFSQYGYIWYDTEHNKLFRYDNSKLEDLTNGIDEIVNKYKFEKCYINIDTKNNRLIFSFDEIFTISFSTITNKYISVLDYKFNKSTHTINQMYIFQNDNIYTYSDEYTGYLTAEISSENDKFVRYDNIYSCFDIIFNAPYNIPKVLNNIRWAHEIIHPDILNDNHTAEYKFATNIQADKIQDVKDLSILIYSDAVDSGRLILSEDNFKTNETIATNPNAYKYPYYEKGVWNYNYFRNKVSSPVEESDLIKIFNSLGITDENKQNKLKSEIFSYKNKDDNKVYYRASDVESLIYGKYFVIRFIYTGDKKLKFDNLDINLTQY